MSTPVKVGARNDVFALKNARRLVQNAATSTEVALRELSNMRQAMGRPNYNGITEVVGTLAVTLAKASRELDEMHVIRANAGVVADVDVDERLAALEAQVAELKHQLEYGRVAA